MKRAEKRADAAIRLVDELLSSKKLQRSARMKLLRLRRELQELREERDVGRRDVAMLAIRWAMVITKLHDVLEHFFD
jgi:ATP-dependent Clp protease ATP-binding subunit ClpA